MPEININNKNFIEQKVFKGETVGQKYPEINYRLRLGGLTEFDPYFSEYPQLENEKDENFKSRQLTSGRFFGEQEILMDDVLHSSINIQNLEIDSTYLDGKIPRSILYLEKAILTNDGKEYLVHSRNLNDLNLVSQTTPKVIFPVDLSDTSEGVGQYVYKKDSAVNHDGLEASTWDSRESKITEIYTDWNQLGGVYTNSSIKDSVGGVDLSKATLAYGIHDTNYTPYSNQLFTEYKVLDSKEVDNPKIDYVLDKPRIINHISDQRKTYTLERSVFRESDQFFERQAKWEEISNDAVFPYVDSKKLTDGVTGNVNFQISGVYDIQETAGTYSSPVTKENDYFEVDIIEDWGKHKPSTKDQTFREDTQELVFTSGERIKLVQKGNTEEYLSFPTQKTSDNSEVTASLDLYFSPYGSGVNGSITGADNEQNYYELEYQLIPSLRKARSLLYEEVPSDTTVAVGDLVFLNTGVEAGIFEPIESNLHGGAFDYIEARKIQKPTLIGSLEEEQDIGPSYSSGLTETEIEPEVVSAKESSGNGYSYFNSGEKYLVVPRGGYGKADQASVVFSAGETRATHFVDTRIDVNYQGDPTNIHRLVEDRYFDAESRSDYVYGKERAIRVKETGICRGDSASELPDQAINHEANYLLDAEYNTRTEVKRNATILNTDSIDGTVHWDNQKSNPEEFERKFNLFFEKDYVASLTILATGQEQNIEYLSQFMEDDKVYYLERDIYIDADTRTQANRAAPTESSKGRGDEMTPFSVSPATPNPNAIGEERLYVSQVYHKQKIKGAASAGNFPFNDYSYYNLQPTVMEEFVYANSPDSIDDNFNILNYMPENVYTPGNYQCQIRGVDQYMDGDNNKLDGYSILGYQGASLTGDNGVGAYDKITFNSLADYKLDVSFTPLDTGVYYEVQGRRTVTDCWTTLSHAVESYDGVGSINLSLNDKVVIQNSIPPTFQMRALEWRKSPITTAPNGMVVRNESPDSLILASSTSLNIHDESKNEHCVLNEDRGTGSVALGSETWNSKTVQPIVFTNDDEKYLHIPNHRSFHLQKGDFSFEFWLKDASFTSGKDNNIISKGDDYEIVLASGPEIQFKAKVQGVEGFQTLLKADITTSSWTHVAICGVYGKENLICKLFIDGERVDIKDDLFYDSLVPINRSDSVLKIGGGLAAKLYQARIYIGKSNYRGNFAVPTTEFSKEASPLRYKGLKYRFRRRVSPLSNWIINRNQFDNSNPPDYITNQQPEDTYHSYKWLESVSTSTELNSPQSRARLNYLTNYAYRTPNNPHINKNYEGTPITNKDFSNSNITFGSGGDAGAAGNPLAGIIVDNYSYSDRSERRSRLPGDKCPYYFEYLGDSKIADVRNSKKGGLPCREIASNEAGISYTKASRLRVTRYVYRLYTKSAVVLGDVGYPSSRSVQGGWDYQLQYKTRSGDTWSTYWTDVDSSESGKRTHIFYRDEYGNASLETFDNIDVVNTLSVIMVKSDISNKYKPDDIKFRISKRQIVELGDRQRHGNFDVYKSVNPLPYEVNIPADGSLANLSRAGTYTAAGQGGHVTVSHNWGGSTNLDPETTYIVQRASDETILTGYDSSDNKLQRTALSEETSTLRNKDQISKVISTLENLPADRPISVKGVTNIVISGSNLDTLGDVDSYVGLKPSGMEVQRLENSLGETKIAESLFSSINNNKVFITPSITGSQIDELNDFSVHSSVGMSKSSNLQFTGVSYITGDGQTTTSQAITGITFDTVHKFYNSPTGTSSFDVDYGDAGKTFVCSGALAIPNVQSNGRAYNFDIVNISDDAIPVSDSLTLGARNAVQVNVDEAGSLSLGTSSGTHTPVPNVDFKQVEGGEPFAESLFLMSGLDKVTTSNEGANFRAVNIGTGEAALVNATSVDYLKARGFDSNADPIDPILDESVVLIEPGKVYVTTDDASEIIFVDSHSEVVLPDFSDEQSVTILNATDDEIRVVSASGDLVEDKNVHYIPKKTAHNLECKVDSGVRTWSASTVDTFRYNQLSVGSSDFDSSNVIVHNEDVDVRVNSDGMDEGDDGKYVHVVRSQVNEDFDADRAPIIRVFIDNNLKYVSSGSVFGVRIEKTSSGWEIKRVPLVNAEQLLINNASHGSVYLYKGGSSSLTLKFDSLDYDKFPNTFEIFLVIKKGQIFTVHLESSNEDNAFSFMVDGDETNSKLVGSYQRTEIIKISRKDEDGNSVDENTFIVESFSGEADSLYKFSSPVDTRDRILVNRKSRLNVQLPKEPGDFNLVVANFNRNHPVGIMGYPKEANREDDKPVEVASAPGDTTIRYSSFEARTAVDYNPNPWPPSPSRTQDFYGTSVVADTPDAIYLPLPSVDQEVAGENNIKSDAWGYEVDWYKPASYFTALNNTGDDFHAPNHGLLTKQKIVFNCERLVQADYYYQHSDAGAKWEAGAITAFSDMAELDTLLLYDTGQGAFYFVEIGDVSGGTATFDKTAAKPLPESSTYGDVAYDFEYNGDNLAKSKLIFACIRRASKIAGTVSTSIAGNVYNLEDGQLSTATAKTNAKVIALGLDNQKSVDLYVKVINSNVVRLYTDASLTSQVTPDTTDFSFMSDTFSADKTGYSKVNFINTSSVFNVNDEEHGSHKATFAENKSAEIRVHEGLFTSGDLVHSGVHLATGYNDAVGSSSTAISSLATDTVFLSGKFRSKGALDDASFDGSFYINAGLDKVEINNTDQSNSSRELDKDRAYKLNSNDVDFVKQDAMGTTTADVIYYPKNEIHIPNRKGLGAVGSVMMHAEASENFVFYKPKEHNEDLKIVLPSSFSNLASLYADSPIKVVNLHDREVEVVSFSDPTGVKFTLKSLEVATFTSATDFGSVSTVSIYDKDNSDTYKVIGRSGLTYTLSIEEDSVDLTYEWQGGSHIAESFHLLQEGDIVIEHDIHHGKTIIADGPTRFLLPYFASRSGTSYETSDGQYFNGSSAQRTAFSFVNISRGYNENDNTLGVWDSQGILNADGVQEDRFVPMVTYKAELKNAHADLDGGSFGRSLSDWGPSDAFVHFTPIRDEQNIKIEHAKAILSADSGEKYFVFGKQISLDLTVHLEKPSQGDLDLVNYVCRSNVGDKEIIYKISGIGGNDVTDLKIVNTYYESVNINSLTIDEEQNLTSSERESIKALLLGYFRRDPFRYNLWTESNNSFIRSGGEANPDNFEIPIGLFEGRNKTFGIKLGDILRPALDGESFESCLFGTEGDEIIGSQSALSVNGVVSTDLVKTYESSATTFKIRDNAIDVGVRNFSYNAPENVTLPLRDKLSGTKDFLIINGSRRSVTVTSPERVSASGGGQFSATIAAGEAAKIRFTSLNGYFADITSDGTNGIELLNVDDAAIFSTASGVYVASSRNDSDSAVPISNDIENIRIVNITGEPFYVKNSDASKTFAEGSAGASHSIATESYSIYKIDGDSAEYGKGNFIVDAKNKDVELTNLRQEYRILEIAPEVYENEVLLFNPDQFDTVSFLKDDFFATTVIPIVSFHQNQRNVGSDRSRIIHKTVAGASVNYENQSGTVKRNLTHPCKISASGVPSLISISCHLFEFILDTSFHNKIVHTKKQYDYVLKNNQILTSHLYQDFDGPVDIIGYGLTDRSFVREGEDLLYKVKSFSGGTDTGDRIPVKIVQAGSVSSALTITKKQIYLDILRDIDYDVYVDNRVYNHFYFDKSYYVSKVVVLNAPVDVICTSTQNAVLVNNSGHKCLIFNDKSEIYHEPEDETPIAYIGKNQWTPQVPGDGQQPDSEEIVEPKNEISSANLVTVIKRPSHVVTNTALDINGLKLLNTSNKTLTVDSSAKIYSAERVDYTTLTDANYSECVKSSKQDWFIKLKNVDYPYLLKDPNYFNQEEHLLEFKLGKKGQINVDHIGARFKFSNIFRYDSSFLDNYGRVMSDGSIGTLDSAYKYGMTLFGDKKGDKREAFFNVDNSSKPVDWDVLSGLKLSWDMPDRVIAYSMNTGHERLNKCKHFDERTGLITLEGIRPNKYYKLDEFEESDYDFVGSMYGDSVEGAGVNNPNVTTGSFLPSVYYDGKYYPAGTRFKGVTGVTDYKIDYQYFASFKVSQFDADGMDDADSDLGKALKEDRKVFLESQSKFDSQKQWTKIDSSINRSDFITGRVTKKIEKESGYEDLTKGKKIEDFEKKYKEITNVHENNPYKGQRYVDITIPRNNDFDYLNSLNEAWVSAGSNESASGLSSVTDQDLTLLEVRDEYLKFRIRFDDNGIVAPGYEYKIKGSVKYDKNTNIASGKSLLSINLSEKSTAPFVAHGKISTLNEDFATPGGEEFVARNMDALRERYEHSSGVSKEETSNRMYSFQSLSENESFFTLKNAQGYAFVPFGVIGGAGDPLVGLRLSIRRDQSPYAAIRFRLKKLTDRRLIFEDIKKDREIGTFFDSDRKLKYLLKTDLTAMSYHDVLRPGGVAQLAYKDWNVIVQSAGSITTQTPIMDGDCIIFEINENNIIARKPYPVRVTNVTVPVDDESPVYTFSPLIVYTPADITGITTKLNFTANNRYKIVNYFNLWSKRGENNHRGKAPIDIKTIYGIDDDADSTTVKYPIVIGSKRFYIEKGVVFNPSGEELVTETSSIDDNTVRVNLELSSIAKHWLSNNTEWVNTVRNSLEESRWEAGDTGAVFEVPAPHWNQKEFNDSPFDIFSEFRNLLYRASSEGSDAIDEKANDVTFAGPVQIELVNRTGNTYSVNVKLATNADYRYIYKKTEKIKKIEINGSEITANTAGITRLTSPDIIIDVEIEDRERFFNDTAEKDETFDKVIKPTIHKNFLLMESAECIDQIEVTQDSPYTENELDYFDYQLPILNTDYIDPFVKPYESYYTEGYNWLTAYGHKQDNLVAPKDFKPYSEFKAGLMYDGGMPASIKYIYPEVVDSKGGSITSTLEEEDNVIVRFFINRGYWDGFKDRFGGESELFRTRPKEIVCDLQKLNLVDDEWVWGDVSWGKTISFKRPNKDWQLSSIKLEISADGYDPSASYRLKVINVKILHGAGDENEVENSALRFPFSLSKSVIYDSDITDDSIENGRKGIWEHRLSLIENPIIKNSLAFPAEGLTKLGKYEFIKIIEKGEHTYRVPCTRYYMYRLKHSISMSYIDKINRGGIANVKITKLGRNYKLPPTVAINKPDDASRDDFRAASARAMIEGGQLKHIEVTDSGSGYFDSKTLTEKEKDTYVINLIKNSKKSKTPVVLHSSVIQDTSFTENSCVLTSGQAYITHDGSSNIITGARVEGTGIPAGAKVLSVESSIRFTLSNNATSSGTEILTFDSTELELAFISLEDHAATLKTASVTLTSNIPAKEQQEQFGLLYPDTEVIADEISGGDLDSSSDRLDVDFMKGSAEDDETWSLIQDRAERIQKIKNISHAYIKDSSDSSNHGIFTEDEYSDLKGRESEFVDGLYVEDELDVVGESASTIETDGEGASSVVFEIPVTEEGPPATKGAAIALINDRSVANYRIIDNELADKHTPHISSFSREDSPSMPKSFGIVPTAPLTGEVFNTYGRIINNMHSIAVEAPIYAKVRRYRQYEYRHIENMAGLTFESLPKLAEPVEVEDQTSAGTVFAELDYTEFDKKSKVNYFTFVDRKTGSRHRAYFSAFGDSETSQGALGSNILKVKTEEDKAIYDFSEDAITELGKDREFEIIDGTYSPKDIGLPSRINIPESAGVVCPPAQTDGLRGGPALEDGIELPVPNNRRASAYSGKKVFTSEIYDISDEHSNMYGDLEGRSFVNIRGSEYIYSSSENEIIFGCFFSEKPFLSTFLKTTREWTEYEVIVSPEFAETLPVGVREKYNPEESKLTGEIITRRITCSNEKFSTVEKSRGYHSLCNGGSPINGISDASVSYEYLFGLNEGDDIIGPVETDSEASAGVLAPGKGTLKIEPEFNLALAVYATNKRREYRVATNAGGTGTSARYVFGPCIHKCSPRVEQVLKISDDPLIFDLRK